jgi:hypothetical protein
MTASIMNSPSIDGPVTGNIGLASLWPAATGITEVTVYAGCGARMSALNSPEMTGLARPATARPRPAAVIMNEPVPAVRARRIKPPC